MTAQGGTVTVTPNASIHLKVENQKELQNLETADLRMRDTLIGFPSIGKGHRYAVHAYTPKGADPGKEKDN